MFIKTHYNNLNVAKDASSEAIRGSYKAIIQRCEADLSPKADASRFLKTINDSFAVLSNPVQRAEYDQWLVEQESANAENKLVNSKTKSARKADTGNIKVDKIANTKTTLDSSESSISTNQKENNLRRWLIYAGIALAILLGLKWFDILGANTQNNVEPAAQNAVLESQQDMSSQYAVTQDAKAAPITEVSQNTATIVATNVPDHDQASINEFIGLWKGSNGVPAGQQTLDISLKSENSIVFNLDAKAGKFIGGVYGIAEFANSYANFYNKEYNCSILFTIKSGVLQLNTSNCKAYHETGISFDGKYNKPSLANVDTKPNAVKSKSIAKNIPARINQDELVEAAPVVAVNAPKLLKFIVTVKDATGKTSKIELIAKDKEAAKAIIRDYRGNPKVVKIKEL